MENPWRNSDKNSNNRHDERGFTLIEVIISTSLFVMIVTITVMIFFQTYKTLEVSEGQQESVNQLISMQIIKPHIRQGKSLAIDDEKLVISKWNNETAHVYELDGKLLLDVLDDSGVVSSQQHLMHSVNSLNFIMNGPCSVEILINTNKSQHKISEFCR